MAPPPGIVEVRCAGCEETLEVEHGLTEFACPDCGMAQALPPELMPRRPRRALPLPGRGAPFAATPTRVSCGGCGAMLSVPHGHGRFACPLCGAELAASPAAAVSVIAPPAAVPITPSRPAQPSEVPAGCSSQSIHAGQILKPIHSDQTHGYHRIHSFREELSNTFRADTGIEIPVVGRLQNEPANPFPHREESHSESLNATISRPGKKKSVFAAGPESICARKLQEEHPNQVLHAPEAQGMPSKSSVHTDKAEGTNDTLTTNSKQKTGYVAAPSIIEHEQTTSPNRVDDVQQEGEIPNNVVRADQAQVFFATKATRNKKNSAKATKGKQKRKNELPHLRRSKRLVKGSTQPVDPEPIEKIDASPNQSQSEAPQINRTSADPDSSSPVRSRFPQYGSNKLDDSDAITPPASNHNAPQADQFAHIQMYSPETRWELPVPSSNLWHEHAIPQESFSGIDQLARDPEEVCPNPSDTQNQDMEWQIEQEACSDNNSNSKEAPCDDVLPGSISNPSKKRRGRAPEKLMEPRKEADRPVLTPSGIDTWIVHPPCPKVANTLSLLIKQNYPGTYVSVDTSGNGQSCEHVVYHWHQCPPDIRSTILDEFLKRYKWSPGQEEECQKIFDRKAVRQLVNLFCREKQTVKEKLVAKKAKKSLAFRRACGQMEPEDDREDSEARQGDESIMVPEHDDPLKWKPYVPGWMKPKWWEMLCDHWAKDEVMKMSYQQRKNRNSGKLPCKGSRSRPMHQQLDMDIGIKLQFDIDSPSKIPNGKGKSVEQKACQTKNSTDQHNKEAGATHVGAHPVQGQTGSWKRVRYCGAVGVNKKAQNESLAKSSPVCVSKQAKQPMFTKEQVQEMINQALQGLNEVWEKKFLSLEQKGAKSLGVGRNKQCQLARQDSLDSVDGGNDPAGRDDGDNQDEEEH